MLRVLALALCLTPALAAAQVSIIESSDFPEGDDEIINIDECNGAPGAASTFAISYKVGTTGTTSVVVKISDTAGCPVRNDQNTTATTADIQSFTSATGTVSPNRTAVDLRKLLGITCNELTLKSLNVCAVVTSTGTTGTTSAQSAVIQLDLQRPGKPEVTEVTPGESALDVSWNSVSGASRYKVIVSDGSVEKFSPELSNTTSYRFGKLENGETYQVSVVALSLGGNLSERADPKPGTPVEVQDFWRMYRDAEGADEGGCSTGSAGALALLGVAALALRRRARRVLPLVLLAAALPARAEEVRRVESPRWGSFEFKVLPYRPDVDAGIPADCTARFCDPYQTAFGGGRKAMFRAEVAKTLVYDYGSLDVGVGAGFWQVRGKGRLPDGSQSADRTSLRIVPTSVYLTYRFDLLANRYPIPLAPYVKAGFERYNWWVTGGAGGTTSAGGKKGRGATNGYSYGGGLAFQLDVVDRGLSVEMDRDTGINHTYVFVEAMKYQVDDFGSKSSIDLSSDRAFTLGAGLLFVF